MPEPAILFEDDAILVLNKPSGLQTVPDEKTGRKTLADWLAENYPEHYIVHRLDRETSGLLIVAKTELAQGRLKKQFARRQTRKTYRAFVYGTADERGIIDKPIGSARGGLGPRSAKKPYGELREATTVYRRIAIGEGASYVEVFPKTGRTHQIRVHFAAIGHPVVCDAQYGVGRPPLLGFERLALHALSLAFVHPTTGEEVQFEAPLPADFQAAEAELRK